MAFYAICTYDIADAKAYEPYVPAVLPILARHGGEVLAADFSATAVEGQAPTVQVILRFESEAAARRWYDDPEYTRVKQIRLGATTNSALVFVNAG